MSDRRRSLRLLLRTLLALVAVSSLVHGHNVAAESVPAEPVLAEPVLTEQPNPYLSFLPADSRPDWQRWRQVLADRGRYRRAAQSKAAALDVHEMEPAGRWGDNDLLTLAEPLPGFGNRPGQTARVRVAGNLLKRPADQTPPPAILEGDDAIPDSRPLVVQAASGGVSVVNRIGDGLYGSSGVNPSGDFDFYTFSAEVEDRIEISVLATAELDPFIALYDSAGRLVAFNDNLPQPGFLRDLNSYLAYTVDRDGSFFAVVGGVRRLQPSEETLDLLPADPFVPGSGGGVGSEGEYELVIRISETYEPDVDVFSLDLQAGDVIGATLLEGALRLALVNGEGELVVASTGSDLSALYPSTSPLPGGGLTTIAAVIDTPGNYGLVVESPLLPAAAGEGDYLFEAGVFRPPLARAGDVERQILFLDFDGARLDLGIFDVPSREVTLSPLRSFVERWGLSIDDEDRLIDAIVEVVRENLENDLRQLGRNGDFQRSGLVGEFDIEIRNSRDHADSFGEARVSRVIVGGSIAEFSLRTIGIAEAIDVGNFDTEGTAVVLLDLLSDPAPAIDSLNSVEHSTGISKLGLVAVGVGNIVAHEAGHLMANFHTERDEGPITLMDRGGNIPGLVGVGEDGVFGTSDDQDIDFEPDRYEPLEAFDGIENTRDALAFGLPAGGARARLGVFPESHDFGAVALGSTSEQRFRVYNDGNRVLEFFAPPELAAPSSFILSEIEGGPVVARPLEPGESREWLVRYAPEAVGVEQGNVHLTSDDPGRLNLAVALRGQGGTPTLQLAPQRLDFGELIYGPADLSIDRQIELSHSGVGPLVVSLAGVAGPGAPSYSSLVDDRVSLEPGERQTLDVQFRPGGSVGRFDAALWLLSNDPRQPRQRVDLTGRAAGPDLDVAPDSSFSFGLIRVETRRNRVFNLVNRGNRDLRIDAAVISVPKPEWSPEANHPPFSADNMALPRSLMPGEALDLIVSFEPPSADFFEATLQILSNDPDQPTLAVELQGVGVEPEVVVGPDRIHFGSVALGEIWAQRLEIRNEGNERLAIDGYALGGRDVAEFSYEGSRPPFLLMPGSRTTVDLVFQPQIEGSKEAYFEILTDDRDEARLVIPLLAQGGFLPPMIPALDGRGRLVMIFLLILAMWVILGRRRRRLS